MPYKTIGKIASGTFGTVYKVKSIETNEIFALKLIHENYKTPKELKRIKRGFDSAQKVSSPNCVRMIEWFENENDVGFVMEYVEGEPISVGGKNTLSLQETISKVIQIANGLDALHQNGIVHRDLKPANILVTKSGQIKITDFDLVKLDDASTITKTGAFLGTVKYSSPEQCKDSGKIDFRTDLYSLGVIFYEMVTGELPIKGSTLAKIALSHVRAPVISPKQLVPSLPTEIEKIILRLLEKNPKDRFQSVSELAKLLSNFLQKGNFEEIEQKVENYLLPPTFVSREKELLVLEKAFSESAKGNFQNVFISGVSGIGKSRVLEEFKVGLNLQETKIFDIKCRHEGLVFEPLKNLIIQGLELISKISDKEKAEILGKLGWDLTNIYPELAKFKFMERIEKLNQIQGQAGLFRIFEALTTFIKNLSKLQSPLVFSFEDLQWIDEPSAKYLTYGFRNLRQFSLMFLGTYRSNEIADSPFGNTLQELETHFEPKIVEINPLKLEEVVEILTSILGKSDPVETDFAKFVLEKSNGNPLFIREIIQNLFVKREIFDSKGNWKLDSKHLLEVEIPNTIHSVISERIQILDPKLIEILEIVSVIGKVFEFEFLSEISAIETDKLKSILKPAFSENILENYSETEIAFVHDIVRESFERNIEINKSKELHKNVGEYLERKFENNINEIVQELADHFYIAEEIEKTADYCQSAAMKLIRNYDFPKGQKYLRQSINIYLKINQFEKVIKIKTLISFNLFVQGKFQESEEMANEVLKLLKGSKDYVSFSKIYNCLGNIYLTIEKYEESRQNFQKSSEYYKLAGNHINYLQAQGNIANTYYLSGDLEKGIEYINSSYNKLKDIGDLKPELARLKSGMGVIYAEKGEIDKAILIFKEAIVVYEEIKDIYSVIPQYENLAKAYSLKKHFKNSIKYYKIAKDLNQEVGLGYSLINSYRNLAVLYNQIGDFNKALENYKHCLKIFESMGDYNSISGVSSQIGNLQLDFLQFSEALKYFNLQLKTNRNLKDELGVSEALENIAKVKLEENELSEALENINSALEISAKLKNPNLESSQLLLKAKIFTKQNETNLASAFLDKSLNLALENKLESLVFQGNILKTQLGEKEKAILKLEEMLNNFVKDEEQAEINFQLSLLKRESSLKNKALSLFEKLHKSTPKIIFEKRIKELKALKIDEVKLNFQLIKSLSKWMQPETLFDEFLDFLQKETNSYGAQIILKNEAKDEFETIAVSSNLDDLDINFSQTILQKAIAENKPTLIHNAVEVPEYEGNQSIIGKLFLSVIAVPLEAKGKVIGAVYLDRRNFEEGELTESDLQKVIEISKILSPALQKQNEALNLKVQSEVQKLGLFIGNSPKMQNLYQKIENAAKVNYSVYIHGETGTGKELVAKALHKFSNRRDEKFIVINCATIPKDLAESELFGHEKGAFSGAISTKKGKFELSNGGTLFLDEIGELPLDLQAKLLRAIQEKEIWRVGGESAIKIDLRIIVATHKDLNKEVESGNFREDLYHRLNVLKLEIPPLRNRREDIPILTYHFLSKIFEEIGRDNLGITAEAVSYLESQEWKGNVRELENTIAKAVVSHQNPNSQISLEDFSEGKVIERKFFTEAKFSEPVNSFYSEGELTRIVKHIEGTKLNDKLDVLKEVILKETLERHNGNKSKAAKELGIDRKRYSKL